MKTSLRHFIFLASLVFTATLLADDAERLAGKWSGQKVDDKGQPYTQTIEIKQNKFVYQRLEDRDKVTAVAQGDFKLEKVGPFKTARFSHVRAGESAANLEDIDEEYVSVYALDEDTWTLASNFDKQREQKPGLDVYQRVKIAETRTLIINEIEMLDAPQSGTWFLCLQAKADGVSSRYHLENKGYNKKQVTIPVLLELPKVRAGQKCNFTLQLDDVDDDVCTDEVDNRSAGEFTISERGSQSYKPEDNWRYTVRWHLK
jgi:hypothetical protein